jgi:hypothetical protein
LTRVRQILLCAALVLLTTSVTGRAEQADSSTRLGLRSFFGISAVFAGTTRIGGQAWAHVSNLFAPDQAMSRIGESSSLAMLGAIILLAASRLRRPRARAGHSSHIS